MSINLNEQVIEILRCPLCKSKLVKHNVDFECTQCPLKFYASRVQVSEELAYFAPDFRIKHPRGKSGQYLDLWEKGQKWYEDAELREPSLEHYLAEIDSVKEIYTHEFNIDGKILDVGGHQGRLRHFLGNEVLYVSIDPFVNALTRLDQRVNLISAYPCLKNPQNFIAGYSEFLPFRSESFDWIHMRSVIDHFLDPFAALVEAFRVTRSGGFILLGTAIREKLDAIKSRVGIADLKNSLNRLNQRLKSDGFWGTGEALTKYFFGHDHHIYRPSLQELRQVLDLTGWISDGPIFLYRS